VRYKTSEEQINRSAAAARSAMAGDLNGPAETTPERQRRGTPPSDDSFFDHYFKRIDPQVAASFTPAQRQAIRTMFGARGFNRHAVDIRRGITIGASRFYMVLLMGREHRALRRLPRSGLGRLVGYFMLALLLLVPIFAAVYLLKTLAGIDVLAAGDPPTGVIAQQPPPESAQM
jgi:hypothetical protein